MTKNVKHAKIYKLIIELLEKAPLQRSLLVEGCIEMLGLSKDELSDCTLGSASVNLRSRIGSVVSEMQSLGLIDTDNRDRYYLVSEKPVAIRIEKCESETLKLLCKESLSRSAIHEALTKIFGTNKTKTKKDDDSLSNCMGQVLKYLVAKGTLVLADGKYSLSPRISAKADDIIALSALKSDFLSKLHSKGGEFFENYFMNLLKKHTEKHGKKVLECYVTGGSSDGGIDGIMKTEDILGFRETTMVQTKNRTAIVSETDVRSFYGAVCAKRGTRGIFTTTSKFHSGALEFISKLDDTVGIDGDKIFLMAIECSYGIKRSDKNIEIDNKILG